MLYDLIRVSRISYQFQVWFVGGVVVVYVLGDIFWIGIVIRSNIIVMLVELVGKYQFGFGFYCIKYKEVFWFVDKDGVFLIYYCNFLEDFCKLFIVVSYMLGMVNYVFIFIVVCEDIIVEVYIRVRVVIIGYIGGFFCYYEVIGLVIIYCNIGWYVEGGVLQVGNIDDLNFFSYIIIGICSMLQVNNGGFIFINIRIDLVGKLYIYKSRIVVYGVGNIIGNG